MRTLAFALTAIAALATAGLASASQASATAPSVARSLPCSAYERMAEILGERYGEAPASLGVQGNGHLLQVFTSAESGSWTILSIAPSGVGCVIAAGQNWRSRDSAPLAPPA